MTAPYFLTFTTPTTTSVDVETVDANFLTFTYPVTRTVISQPQQELLVVTPGGVPGLPGPTGPTGPAGPTGPEGPFGGTEALTTHINDSTPHPAYDDVPALVLLFENGLI